MSILRRLEDRLLEFLWERERVRLAALCPKHPVLVVTNPIGVDKRPKKSTAVSVLDYSIENQLKFLLNQAPMLDAPTDIQRAAHMVVKFAYVHPKTFAKFAGSTTYTDEGGKPYILIRPSPTKWVVTSLMPEGRVILTPNPMPGIERLLV